MVLALNHDLRSEHSIKPKRLDVGFLPDGPLARTVRVLPAHVIPIIDVKGQNHHRHLQLKIASAQPRHHELRRRRRRATLRREQLDEHRTAALHLLRRQIRRRGALVKGIGASAVIAAAAALPEAGEETGRHRQRRNVTATKCGERCWRWERKREERE